MHLAPYLNQPDAHMNNRVVRNNFTIRLKRMQNTDLPFSF